MSQNERVIEILSRVEATLKENGLTQSQILICLNNDRQNMWKLLTVVILGAFAIIGVKLAFP